jgi:prepilin-type processing-associated H-X9-DG protein
MEDTALLTKTYPTPELFTAGYGPSVGYPTFHGLHNGFGNIVWCDGHSSAKQPTYRPLTGTYNSVPGASVAAQNMGDVINPAFPFGSIGQNYYYDLVKPTSATTIPNQCVN